MAPKEGESGEFASVVAWAVPSPCGARVAPDNDRAVKTLGRTSGLVMLRGIGASLPRSGPPSSAPDRRPSSYDRPSQRWLTSRRLMSWRVWRSGSRSPVHWRVAPDEGGHGRRRRLRDVVSTPTRGAILVALAISLSVTDAACGSPSAASPTTTTTPFIRTFQVFVDVNATTSEAASIRERLLGSPGSSHADIWTIRSRTSSPSSCSSKTPPSGRR